MATDTTCDTVTAKAAVRFRNKHQTKIRELAKRVHFDAYELDIIVLIYFKLMEDLGPGAAHISRHQFRSVLYQVFDMPDDYLIDRINVALDKGLTTFVTLETWTLAMSMFLRGTGEERMRYCFAAYDILGEGLIRRDQIIQLIKHSAVIKQQVEDVEEAVKDLADLLIKKLDLDLDGAISFRDYSATVLGQPLLLECFGHVLPDRAALNGFLTTFTHKIFKF